MGRTRTASGCSGVLSLRHFGLVLFIPWRVGAEEAGAAKDAIMAYGFGGAVADFVRNSWLRGPRLSYLSPLRARALLARPWSARCYGVARQREGSRQNSIEQGDC